MWLCNLFWLWDMTTQAYHHIMNRLREHILWVILRKKSYKQ